MTSPWPTGPLRCAHRRRVDRPRSRWSWWAGLWPRTLQVERSDTADPVGPFDRRPIYVATGVTMAQLGLAAPVAYARLQAHAFTAGLTLTGVARQVNTHHLRLPS